MADNLSRKRGYDGGIEYDDNDEHSKRYLVEGSNGGQNAVRISRDVMLKVLSPSSAIGPIIGKGGSVLHDISQSTGTIIKVSQSNELYPGTQERVISIVGPREGVLSAIRIIVLKVFESLEKRNLTSDPYSDSNLSDKKDLEFHILMPTTSGGSIIGKGGSIIKDLGEKSGCKLKLGDNQDPYGTKERILSVRGPTADHVLTAIVLSVEQALTEPQHFVYVNPRTTYDIPNQLRPSQGYSQTPPSSSYSQQQSYYQQSSTSHHPPARNAPNSPPSHYNSSPPPPTTNPALPPGVLSPTFSTDGTKIIMQMGLPDNLLGSVIGTGGSIIKEIMQTSGCWAQVSAKSDFIPGTSQRFIKITGSQSQVQNALNNVLGRLQNASRG